LKKVGLVKMDFPQGETPQTETTPQAGQDSENGLPRRGDPADRKNSSNKSGFSNCIPPKGRPRRQNEPFRKVRILKMDSPEGETPQAERAYIYIDIYVCIYIYIYMFVPLSLYIYTYV